MVSAVFGYTMMTTSIILFLILVSLRVRNAARMAEIRRSVKISDVANKKEFLNPWRPSLLEVVDPWIVGPAQNRRSGMRNW